MYRKAIYISKSVNVSGLIFPQGSPISSLEILEALIDDMIVLIYKSKIDLFSL